MTKLKSGAVIALPLLKMLIIPTLIILNQNVLTNHQLHGAGFPEEAALQPVKV